LYINGSLLGENKLSPLHLDENLDNRSAMTFVNLMLPLSALRSTTLSWNRLAIRVYARDPGFDLIGHPGGIDHENSSAADSYLEAYVGIEIAPVTIDPWDVALPRPPTQGLITRYSLSQPCISRVNYWNTLHVQSVS
jgi:hypothetical protein